MHVEILLHVQPRTVFIAGISMDSSVMKMGKCAGTVSRNLAQVKLDVKMQLVRNVWSQKSIEHCGSLRDYSMTPSYLRYCSGGELWNCEKWQVGGHVHFGSFGLEGEKQGREWVSQCDSFGQRKYGGRLSAKHVAWLQQPWLACHAAMPAFCSCSAHAAHAWALNWVCLVFSCALLLPCMRLACAWL